MARTIIITLMFEEPDRVAGEPHVAAVGTGDTIRWTSPGGRARIHFHKASPFGALTELEDGEDYLVTAGPGVYGYTCGVTVNGRVVGWPGAVSESSGGEVVIDQPT